MRKKELFRMNGLGTRVLSISVVAVFIASLAACVAAIPVAVKMYKDADTVKLTMQVTGKAPDIYAAMVKSQMKKSPHTEVIKDDRENLEFEGKKAEGEVKFWGHWKAKQLEGNKTEVKFRLRGEGIEEEALEKRALAGIHAFCAEIGEQCQIEK